MVFTQAIRPFALPTVRAHAARSACQDIHPPFGAGQDFPGAYSAGATPFPIPNRAVKPRCADGTAFRGGRVGRCQETLRTRLRLWAGPRFLWRIVGRLAAVQSPSRRPKRKAECLFISRGRRSAILEGASLPLRDGKRGPVAVPPVACHAAAPGPPLLHWRRRLELRFLPP